MVYLKADAASKSAVQSEADKKVERLAKLAAWKKKQEEKEKKQKDATPGGTRKLLAEMDEKAQFRPTRNPALGSQRDCAWSFNRNWKLRYWCNWSAMSIAIFF